MTIEKFALARLMEAARAASGHVATAPFVYTLF
jgi:hypothetical protein